jgi:phospholipase/lecithinase/hemolysin
MINIKKELTALTAISSLVLSASSYGYSQITNLVSFGDSLSDSGDTHALTGAFVAPYAGVNSNGPVWQQYLANDLGFSHTYSEAGGTGYAMAGARTAVEGSYSFGSVTKSVSTQINNHLTANGGSAQPNTLYTLWSGANDALYAKETGDLAAVPTAAFQIAGLAQSLVDAGAESVLVLNLPNVGLTPLQNGDPVSAGQGSYVSNTFNSYLSAYMAGVTGNVSVFDISGFTDDAVANPTSYGLSNVTDKCLDSDAGTMCPNPGEYLFWDDLHPTTYGMSLIADAVLPTVQALEAAAVPVPAAAWLFLSALGLTAGTKRIRKSA